MVVCRVLFLDLASRYFLTELCECWQIQSIGIFSFCPFYMLFLTDQGYFHLSRMYCLSFSLLRSAPKHKFPITYREDDKLHQYVETLLLFMFNIELLQCKKLILYAIESLKWYKVGAPTRGYNLLDINSEILRHESQYTKNNESSQRTCERVHANQPDSISKS